LLGEVSLTSIIVTSDYGFDILPSASGFLELSNISDEEFTKLLDIFISIDEKYEYVIFDTGAGISENVIRFAPIADILIVITQPEPTAVTDAYAFMKVVQQKYDISEVNLIINKVKNEQSGQLIYNNLKKVVDKFLKLELKLLGFLREDSNLIQSVKSQKPIYIINKKSKYSRDISSIANFFEGVEQKVTSTKSLFNFVRRFAK
jgi:flagellar biosynthesis protein FlhG